MDDSTILCYKMTPKAPGFKCKEKAGSILARYGTVVVDLVRGKFCHGIKP